MTNRIVQKSFAAPPFPRRIEDDPRYNGWNRNLPRLWYLDQRQATRLDAESLYGASQYAVFYNRTQFTTLAAPIETATVGTRGFLRESITDIGIPQETGARIVNYSRTLIQDITGLEQSTVLIRPSGGPVSPIVHPIMGASIGGFSNPILDTPNFLFNARVGSLTDDTHFLLATMDRDGIIVGVSAKRTGGSDSVIQFYIDDADPALRYAMGLPTDGTWYSLSPTDIIYGDVIPTDAEIWMNVDWAGSAPTEIELEITFLLG